MSGKELKIEIKLGDQISTVIQNNEVAVIDEGTIYE